MKKIKKYIKDGKVAVLYSGGFGAGWSTWNREYEEILLFDYDIVKAVLDGNRELAIKIAEEKCKGIYTGGADGLKIEWLDKGITFRVDEYDGAESIELIDDIKYHIA